MTPPGVVHETRAHLLLILAACTISFIGAYQQYFGAISMGFKHHTYSIPLIGNLWFFAHDTTFVVQYHRWFFEQDFWLVKGFWFALLVFACCESVVTYQILRFARHELFPGLNWWQTVGCYGLLQLFAYGVFWWFESMISDPFYYLSFTTTVILAPLLNVGMMRARGSRRGFSMNMLVGFVLLCAGFWIWMALSDAYFRQPFFLLVAIGNLAICAAGILEFRRLPEYIPEEAATHL